jgi:hypothetical protein
MPKLLEIISENGKLSLGRIAFWILFIAIMKSALLRGNIDSSMITMSGLLLTYNAYKKHLTNGKLNEPSKSA